MASDYRAASQLALNSWSLAGGWTIGREFATLNASSGSISYRFHARDLHLVPAHADGRPVRFRVKIDGGAPGADHGSDANADGFGTVQDTRLYQLVRQSGDVTSVLSRRVSRRRRGAYAFTFG